MQTDDCVGRVLDALAEHGLAENTLVMFTSDNGCSPQADFPCCWQRPQSQPCFPRPQGRYLGRRTPGPADCPLARPRQGRLDQRPARLPRRSDATCAELVGPRLPDNAAEDSISMPRVLLGKPGGPVREASCTTRSAASSRSARDAGSWNSARAAEAGASPATPGGTAGAPGLAALRHPGRPGRTKQRPGRAPGSRPAAHRPARDVRRPGAEHARPRRKTTP